MHLRQTMNDLTKVIHGKHVGPRGQKPPGQTNVK